MSNIEEITTEVSIEVKSKCNCDKKPRKKGLKYFVYKLKTCTRSRPCTICVYLFLILILLASIVSLIVIGVLILAPFRKVLDYEHAQCVTLRNPDETIERRCSCGKGCSSTYPCVVIKVHLVGIHNDSASSPTSTLFENESMLMRKVRISLFQKKKNVSLMSQTLLGTRDATSIAITDIMVNPAMANHTHCGCWGGHNWNAVTGQFLCTKRKRKLQCKLKPNVAKTNQPMTDGKFCTSECRMRSCRFLFEFVCTAFGFLYVTVSPDPNSTSPTICRLVKN